MKKKLQQLRSRRALRSFTPEFEAELFELDHPEPVDGDATCMRRMLETA